MKTIQVEVSHEHIDAGEKYECSRCPVALAVAPHLLAGFEIQVALRIACITDGKRNRIVDIPKRASQFIYDFDTGRPVSPFSFALDAPDEVLA